MWLVMHSGGHRIAFNADNIAYIAEPPAVEAALGTGAGVMITGEEEGIIEIEESFDDIMRALAQDARSEIRRRKDDHRVD